MHKDSGHWPLCIPSSFHPFSLLAVLGVSAPDLTFWAPNWPPNAHLKPEIKLSLASDIGGSLLPVTVFIQCQTFSLCCWAPVVSPTRHGLVQVHPI